MPYPVEAPSAKHDVLVLSEDEIPVGDASAVFDALDAPFDPNDLTKKSTVYSYPDSPRSPGPLSRNLIVIGLLDTSNPVVEKLLGPGTMHQCSIGVKRFQPSLPDRDKVNSMNFAKFVTKLRRADTVAILSKDKYGRFGILRPMEDDGTEEKFAADCFVGDTDHVKNLLVENNGNASNANTSDSGLWQPPGGSGDDMDDNGDGLWQPPTGGGGEEPEEAGGNSDGALWMPPGGDDQNDAMDFGSSDRNDNEAAWNSTTTSMEAAPSENTAQKKRSADDMETGGTFHRDVGAATADKFYSGLTRTLDTRSESRLYHMRAFNGWVKATQIQELNPQTQLRDRKRKGSANAPMRVLDLACGKGGDLGKWILHPRKISNYVGVDVARGSLKDAAIRARALRNKLERCTFTCADLGADVPGRLKSPKKKHMQKLLSWSLLNESPNESGTPDFQLVRGGGVSQSDKFDVVSIQFAIHYMMSTRQRARRFFRTVSELLEIGGNLIATTIDARIVLERLMDLGEDLHFDSEADNGNTEEKEVVVSVGAGACRIRFQRDIVKRIFHSSAKDEDAFNEDVFGLEYTFTLVEGSDHAAGVGEAVDLPEWLTPIPVLKSLAAEAGLEMEYGLNFHEFYLARKDPQEYPAAHLALYNMKVLNKDGSISSDEWEISRLYCAVKFRKVGEAQSELGDGSDDEDDADEDDATEEASQEGKQVNDDAAEEKKNQQFYIKAMMKAKMLVGRAQWDALSGEEKKRLTQIELKKLMGH